MLKRPDPDSGLAVRWGAVAMCLLLVHLVLSLAIEDAALRLGPATRGIRLALVGQEYIAIAAAALFVAVWRKRWSRIAAALIVTVLFTGGWAVFTVTDRFPGTAAANFFFTVPLDAIEHVIHLRAVLLLTIPVALAGGTLLLSAAATHAEARAGMRVMRAVSVGAALLLAIAFVWLSIVHHAVADDRGELYDVRTGVSYRAGEFWLDARLERAGPLSTLAQSIYIAIRGVETELPADPSIVVDRPHRDPGQLPILGTPRHLWNVLVIEVESMRADVLASMGGDRVVMPTLEEIAREATRYRDTYTTATQTNLAAPVPLSGQFPLRDATPHAYPIRAVYPKVLLWDLLQPLGWRTGVFSSQNEAWWGMANFLRTKALDTLFDAEHYDGPTYRPRQDLAFLRFVLRARRSGKIDDHDTVREALRWMGRDRAKPFLLYLNMQTSHIPYTAPAEAPRRFGNGPPSFTIMFGRFPPESVEVVRNQYRNALAYIDDQIAQVRAALTADGRWDSTLVVVTGDHGQAFYEHGVAAHANGLWEEELKVPLVVRIPGMPGHDDWRPASHVDIAPTIASLLGLPQQPAWQGMSLAAAPPGQGHPRFFMVESPLANQVGVELDHWKLVRNLTLGSLRMNYLLSDSGERQDLAHAQPAQLEYMRKLLDTWRAAQLNYYESDIGSALTYPPRVVVPR